MVIGGSVVFEAEARPVRSTGEAIFAMPRGDNR
jgi:hypothetical protein